MSICLQKKWWKLGTLAARMSYWQTSNYTRIKNNKRLLLKPFGYKVMKIYFTHGYYFQTWEDTGGQLHTSKHNYYRIMTIASKALHQIKHNWGSPGYNIKHWLLLLSSSTYLRSCAVHVICTRVSIKHYNVSQDSWGPFFFEIKQRLKCKTWRDKIHVFFIYFLYLKKELSYM